MVVMDDATRMEVLSSIRRRSTVEMVLFSATLALSLAIDRDYATVGVGMALAISVFRYRTATARIEKIGFN